MPATPAVDAAGRGSAPRTLLRTGVLLRAGAIVAAAVVVWICLAGSASGQAGERIRRFDVAVDLRPSGALVVTEVIDYDFGGGQRRGIFRYVPVRVRYDDRFDRIYRVEDVEVAVEPLEGGRLVAGGTVAQVSEVTLTDESDNRLIRVGHPDVFITGSWRYTLRYLVTDAVETVDLPRQGPAEVLTWNVIGDGWSVPIDTVGMQVRLPVTPLSVSCYVGALGSVERCPVVEQSPDLLSVDVRPLGPGEGATVEIALPPGSVADATARLDERWSLSRAFAANPLTLSFTALFAAVLGGGVARLISRESRDRRLALNAYLPSDAEPETEGLVGFFEKPEGPVRFRPPEDMTPGLCGVIVDERADTLDVTATIVDLATRGYLRIEEVRNGKDFTLRRLRPPGEELLPYERRLMEELFTQADDHGAVTLSELRTKFSEALGKVKGDLYAEVSARKWFRRRPDHVRAGWTAVGVFVALAGVGLTVLLAVFTTFGLVGVPLIVAGIVLLGAASSMPARTGLGRKMLEECVGYERFLEVADADHLRFQEQQYQFVAALPYAMVFGLTRKWAETLEVLQERGVELYPTWYIGSDPTAPFRYHMLSRSLSSFSDVASRSLSAPAPSSGGGFGGGGSFSGGGGGGGGGGSW